MAGTTELSYEIVMATRNRPEAVKLSLPLILRQTRLPEQILIVDSSEDGTPIEDLARDAGASTHVPVLYLRSDAGLTHQRNVGLQYCKADVVIFPDDDSLLYLDAAEQLMKVYEADTEGLIAGIAAQPVDHAPPETEGDLGSYEVEPTSTGRRALRGLRQRFKEILGVLNPFVSVGLRLNAQYTVPGWLAEQGAVVVPYMTGFRMSYRRDAIMVTGFDETLQKYGWFEDIDGSFSALRQGKVLTAVRSRIYHHRVAAARADGHRMGVWAILNRGYVVMKHVHANPHVFPRPSREAVRLRAYCQARTIAYRLLARRPFDKERAAGAVEGMRHLDELIRTPPDQLEATYKRLEQI